MCAVEDAEPWKMTHHEQPVARKPWPCRECRRPIPPGERYHLLTGLNEYGWERWRWCAHCDAMAQWMVAVCRGYILGNLYEELTEHWQEGFANVAFGRLIVGMKHRWHDGADPVPSGVADLAQRMMREQVAA